MIDQQVFLKEIGILMDWFSRDFESRTLKRLHQRLSQHLTTEEFKQAASVVFDTARFFPTGATRKSEFWQSGGSDSQ